MLTGKRFELRKPTAAIDIFEGKRVAVTIPDGAIVKVVSASSELVDVLWEGRTVAMFATDVSERGTEIKDRSAHA